MFWQLLVTLRALRMLFLAKSRALNRRQFVVPHGERDTGSFGYIASNEGARETPLEVTLQETLQRTRRACNARLR